MESGEKGNKGAQLAVMGSLGQHFYTCWTQLDFELMGGEEEGQDVEAHIHPRWYHAIQRKGNKHQAHVTAHNANSL